MINRHYLPTAIRRAASPLSSIDLNASTGNYNPNIMASPPSQHPRLKRTMTYSECSPSFQATNLSFKENMEPQSRPRFTFSVRSKQTNKKAPSIKFNLMASCQERAHAVVQRSLSINPFSLAVPEVAQAQASEEMGLDDFIKIRELGKGKFGTVWLSIHKQTNFLCALKIIKKQIVRQQKVEHQVAKQIRIHNKLKHRNIINFYGYFTDNEHFYIVSQYATEGHLFGQLKKHHRLEQDHVQDYTRQTLEGLQYIHNYGFIHRDIKPENILLQFGVVKICDFGWAAECWGSKMRQSQCGTPLYYSPEIVKKETHNTAIDVWSIGLLAYELIVGRVPFKIWSQFDLHVILEHQVTMPDYIDCSEELGDFVTQCLVKNQKERPSLNILRHHEFLVEKNSLDPDVELYMALQTLL